MRKENKTNNLFNVCVRFPQNLINIINNQCCLRSGENVRMLKINKTDYVDYVLGKALTNWQKMVNQVEELFNKLC